MIMMNTCNVSSRKLIKCKLKTFANLCIVARVLSSGYSTYNGLTWIHQNNLLGLIKIYLNCIYKLLILEKSHIYYALGWNQNSLRMIFHTSSYFWPWRAITYAFVYLYIIGNYILYKKIDIASYLNCVIQLDI